MAILRYFPNQGMYSEEETSYSDIPRQFSHGSVEMKFLTIPISYMGTDHRNQTMR
jgi:hypothetical protein